MDTIRRRAEILSIILALSAATTAAMPVVSEVYASSSEGKPSDPNRFGEEARELAQADEEDDPGDVKDEGSEMGEHSRESDADPGPGRLGIGNLPGHPSDSIAGLCDDDEGNDNCPGAIAD
jgi:hypothetical protein